MDGLLPINKPRGMTSADVVYKVRKILHIKKIGHSGTLDPNVDGVLPLAIGTATKAITQLQSGGKVYTGEVTLGFATTTEDLDGEVVTRTPLTAPIADDAIDTAMATFNGDIIQVAPMYSAVRVNGRRLYEYARAGETVARPERHAHISEFVRTSATSFDADAGTQSFTFRATVSKGTYIRTLSVDLGRKLGFAAVMSQLTRQQSGGFALADSVTLAQLAQAAADGTVDTLIDGVDWAYGELPALDLTDAQWQIVQHGHSFLTQETTAPRIRVYRDNVMKGIYRFVDGAYKPETMYLGNTVLRATRSGRRHQE